MVGRFATLLRERGLGRNDRVALLANNSIEHLLCYFGVMAAGATVCTVHIEMNRNQLGNIFERLRPRLILYQDGLPVASNWPPRSSLCQRVMTSATRPPGFNRVDTSDLYHSQMKSRWRLLSAMAWTSPGRR